jgi:hypothetical protein
VSEKPQKQSPAAAAAEQVRAIVEAAERETEAQLRRVQEAADGLGARADQIERELERLAEGVRDAVRALRADLNELRGGAAASKDPAPEPVAKGATVAHGEPPEEIKPPAEKGEAAEAEAAAEVAEAEPAAEAAGVAPPGNEGARVIALNMALSGTPREQTAAYLAENFELDDPDALLDDVYARAGA